jgi:hypothetical protein
MHKSRPCILWKSQGRGCEERLVDFALGGAGLSGYNGWSYNHSDESEGDQDIVHRVILLSRSSSERLNTLIIGPVSFLLNPTKRLLVIN